MANNFSDSQVSLANANLTDIFTASNKSLVIAGTISNTGATAINVALKNLIILHLLENLYLKIYLYLLDHQSNYQK